MKQRVRWMASVLSLLSLPWASAGEKGEEDWIRKPVSFILWEEVRPTLWVLSDHHLIPILDASPYRRSQRIDYQGPGELRLFAGPAIREMGGENPLPVKWTEELIGYTPLGSVRLKTELKQALVLLIPGGNPLDRVQGTAFEDHPQDFPYGSFKFFNVTSRELIGSLEGQTFKLNPGRNQLVQPEKRTNGVLDFTLGYRNDGGDFELAQKTIFRYRIRRREIIFIKEDAGEPGHFQTLSVMEYIPPPPAPIE